jgi:hypothetical protein
MRNKSWIMALIITLITPVFIFGNLNKRPEDVGRQRAREAAKSCCSYDIVATFDPEGKRVSGTQEISYINNTGAGLSEIFFHLYPNAFKSYDTAPFPRSEMARAYPDGFAPGCISIERVFSGEEELPYEIEDTLLKVILPQPLKSKGRINIGIYFSALLPPSLGRYGYGENTFNLGNWYPILAMHDDTGWQTDPYYEIGDPFYSDAAIYTVSIKAPRGYTIAASGTPGESREEGEDIWWTFHADLVRDFAWVASSKFNVREENIQCSVVSSYYIEGDDLYGERALDYARTALEIFNDYFGEYPYPHFAVAASDFYLGGMEYPNLVMIGRQFYVEGDLLEYVVVHETAHQWWYGLVGNNEIKEPWLDEALTEYSTMLYYERRYGREHFEEIYEEYILTPYKLYEMTAAPGAINQPLWDFQRWGEYSALVYYRGAIMLMELENVLGKVEMQKALQQYFRSNMYKNATTSDFVDAINRVSGREWGDYIYGELQSGEPLEAAS